jgi:hypothetical protein
MILVCGQGNFHWRSILFLINHHQNRTVEQPREQANPEVEVDLDKILVEKNPEESGTFDFLGLPRELRDLIYGYVLCPANVDTIRRDEGDENIHAVYDSIRTHTFQHHAISSPPPLNSLASLFLVNREIHAEMLSLLYKSALFIIHMDRSIPVFAPRHFITTARASATDGRYTFGPGRVSATENFHEHTEAEIWAEELHAIPFGWDIRFITRMVLRIDLGHKDCAGVGTMPVFAWPALGQMRSLRKLRLVVTHFHCFVAANRDAAIHSVNAELGTGNRSPEFRSVLNALFSHLPAGIRELEFGAPGFMERHYPLLARCHPEVGGGGAWLKQIVESLSDFIEWKVKVVEQQDQTVRGFKVAVADTDRDVRY